jgi:hypothetical protein
MILIPHITIKIRVMVIIVIRIFRPVVSIPITLSRNREDNITMATLNTTERAIRSIKGKSSFRGKRAQINANPGVIRINTNP